MARYKKEPEVKKDTKELSKQEKLKLVMRDINKKMGTEIVKQANKVEIKERLSTGILELDKMIGGGIVRGLTTTIWGSKGSAKSSIAYSTIASAQKNKLVCAYIDVERAFDPERAKLFGVDIDSETFLYIAAETAENVLDVILKLTKEKVVDLIILDSLNGMAAHDELYEGKAENEKSVQDTTMALIARKLSQFFRMTIPYISEAKCALMLIAQSRVDLGGFIKLEVLSGGHALAHNSRLILKVRHGQGADSPTKKIKNEEGKTESIKIGFPLVIRVDKSQIGGCTEGSEINIPYYFLSGFQKSEDVIKE